MTDDADKKEGGPVFTPPGQSILPGFKREISQAPTDYRSWSDGRGNKLDSPAYQGRTFGAGKLVPPVEESGEPVRLGTFQIIRDARGMYILVDWALPLVGKMPEPDEYGRTQQVVMGKQVLRCKTLEQAKNAMSVLHQHAKDAREGLAEDPAQCFDLAGKRIVLGALSLRRYARGSHVGRYALCDEHQAKFPLCKIFVLKATTLKEAVLTLERENKKILVKPKPKMRYVGAPISFSAPGGGGGYVPFGERSFPEPGSVSWETAVQYFARYGKYPRSADWSTGIPESLESEAHAAREEFLAKEKEEGKIAVDSPDAIKAMKKLPMEERALLNEVLEELNGALVSIEFPR